MGIVCFEGDPPYELIVTRPGQAIAQGENVLLTLPVFVPGPTAHEREIQLLVKFGHAFRISSDFHKAAIEARKHARDLGEE
jgi:hypothetical protein